MITECLEDINKPTDLQSFYNQESPYKYPPLLICQDKRYQQNVDVEYNYIDNRCVSVGNNGKYMEVFNIRNQNTAGWGLQEGYSKNIDIDSHLKCINNYGDRCYYDNYKLDPRKVNPNENRLGYYPNILAPDYSQTKKSNKYPLECQSGSQFKTFQECPYLPTADTLESNQPVHYRFNNEPYCNDWPCERLFYNQTKRRALVNNRHNRFDINPNDLTCCPKKSGF
jgi:hypothetical protein